MKIHISPTEIFLKYEKRSVDHYHPALSKHIEAKFGSGLYRDQATVKSILEEYYNWCAESFEKIIAGKDDWLFLTYLFAYHESSILLWLRTIKKEDIQANYGFSEETLSMNRRIFKLGLEQACVINYVKQSKASAILLRQFDETIEDLLYVGEELYHAAQLLSEVRMVPGMLEVHIQKGGLFNVYRKPHVEAVFDLLFTRFHEDFSKGIMDTEGVRDLKDEIKKCFNIDYDFAAHQIVAIKKHHNPEGWKLQTIEPGILVQNLVANGTSKADADNFYAGLTLSSSNKLSVKESVYKVNSMERHFFRPILEVDQNGNKRHLIGVEKWGESITVLATNNFQWNKAPDEWKKNICFQKYLERKSSEHDALLEEEVEKILNANKLSYFRNITSFNDGKKQSTVNIAGVGEIDFIWLDSKRKRIVVADCKYSRARYDMIAFSADYTNFKENYEKKIKGKAKWVDDNRDLVYSHFQRNHPDLNIDISEYYVEELFIINTPTFYMYLGGVNTTCFFNLEEFIENNYTHPDLTLQIKEGYKMKIKIQPYPYL